LPAEYDELMSQHEQFDVFGELAAFAPDQQSQQSREGEIGERKEHAPIFPSPAREGGKSEALIWAGSHSVARLRAIWYSRARVDLEWRLSVNGATSEDRATAAQYAEPAF
jgi:hypothetical protein